MLIELDKEVRRKGLKPEKKGLSRFSIKDRMIS